MSFTFPIDKLGCLNRALASTGDNTINISEDGSDEWNVCSPAYDEAIGYIMESHGWGFSTQVVTLQPSPTPPQDVAWDTAYPIPADCVHIIWLKINQDTSAPSNQPTLTLYDIMGTPTGPVIVVNAQGGPPPPSPPLTPAAITLKYVSNSGPLSDSTSGTPTLITALTTFVRAAIYRGLHEEPTEADNVFKAAKALLQEARTRYDQQKPKRQFFNPRITASRRIRRPWPSSGIGGWGGGGRVG